MHTHAQFKKEFKGKRILITGGTGSIGSAIVKEVLLYEPRQVRIYSRDEGKQHDLSLELGERSNVSYLIGDIRDKDRLMMAMEKVDIVFHAAAMKHVPACEINPFEAVKTNIQGTQNLIDCAFAQGVDKVVAISTDKATDPTSVMGSTKLLAERMILATYFYKGYKKTKFCCVRFGNVLGTRGSVGHVFIHQIRNGGPVTITDPHMTRFFMHIHDAVGLVLDASLFMKDREIFILKMPGSLTMGDFASAVITLYQKKNGALKRRIPLKVVGRRPGEKTHEVLLTMDECENALETKDMYIILPNVQFGAPSAKLPSYPGAKKAKVREYSSNTYTKMTPTQIIAMLSKAPELVW